MLVHFRKFPEGDIIALFPSIPTTYPYITSYQHIGQHGAASIELLHDLERVTEIEYTPLLAELGVVGYDNLIVGN